MGTVTMTEMQPPIQRDEQSSPTRGKLVEAITHYGQVCVQKGNFTEAEQLFKQALSVAEKNRGVESLLAGCVLLNLFDLYQRQGKAAEAQNCWQRVVNILERTKS